MDQASPLRRVRGAFAALVDVVLAFTGLAMLVAILVATVDARVHTVIAHVYARELALKDEDACPAQLGRAFWFDCAAEVRRLHPQAPAAPEAGKAVASGAKPH